MMALDWVRSCVWKWCTSPHCEVLEKQSMELNDKVLLLQALDQQDEKRLQEEQELCRVVHERLDTLQNRVEATIKNKDRAFQILVKHETEILQRLEQVRCVLALSINLHRVQQAVSQLEAECEASLQKETKQ